MNENIQMHNAPDFGQDSCYDGELSPIHLKELKEVRDKGWCSNKHVHELSARGLIHLSGMHWPSYGGGPLISYALTQAGKDLLTESDRLRGATCSA